MYIGYKEGGRSIEQMSYSICFKLNESGAEDKVPF